MIFFLTERHYQDHNLGYFFKKILKIKIIRSIIEPIPQNEECKTFKTIHH